MDSLALPSDDVQSQELKRWLLRLKYSFILRQRRAGKLPRRRRPQQHSTLISNRCLHLNVLLGLAASAYFLSGKNPTLEQLLEESGLQSVEQIFTEQSRPDKTLKATVIKSVLRQRGVFSEAALERQDLEALAARSGDISRQEALSALSADARLQQFNSTCDPDSRLYQGQFLSSRTPLSPPPPLPSATSLPPACASQSSLPPKTVIFDSVSLFVEQIEDNKQSIWILSVKNSAASTQRRSAPLAAHGRKRTFCSQTGESSVPVTATTWGHLVRRFAAFEVRFGILLCDKLDDICRDHSFSASNLILALPNSIGNGRHAVEFRRFNFPTLTPMTTTACNDASTAGRRACIGQADQVSRWLEEVLAERVPLLTSPAQLLPKPGGALSSSSSAKRTLWPDFMWQKPQPLHLVWVPGVRLLNRTYPVNAGQRTIAFRPPLAFSALAVPHMERSRLWRLDSHDVRFSGSKSPSSSSHEAWPVSSPVAPPVLEQLGCAAQTNFNGDAAFVLITPEGRCQLLIPSARMQLVYAQMSALLHWNFPSTNDVFIAGLLILNAILILRSLLGLVIFMLHCKQAQALSQRVGALLPCRLLLAKKPKARKMVSAAMRTRVCLILNVVKTTFAGWSNYVPSAAQSTLPTSSQTMQPTAENLSCSLSSLASLGVNASIRLVFQLFMANLLFLLAALPVINIMGRALPLVSVLLIMLRGFVSSFRVYSLCIDLSLYCLSRVVLCTIVASLAINVVCTFAFHKLLGVLLKYRSAAATASFTESSQQQRDVRAPCLAKLFRMNYLSAALNSPASLARYLVLSDTEFTNEPPSSPGSSDTDLSSGTATGLCMSSLANVRVSETARLYKKAMELERAVAGSSGRILDAADTEQILHLLRAQNTTQQQQQQRSNDQSNTPVPSEPPPAKIYTWKFSGVETAEPPPARRERTSGFPRQDDVEDLRFPCFQPQKPRWDDAERCYDAGSETDGTAVAEAANRQVVRRRHRPQPGSRQRQLSPSSSSSSEDESRLPVPEPEANESPDPPQHRMVGWPSWVVPCDCCVVCWREFELDTDLAALACGHAFHAPCVKQWLDTGRLICPVCRWPANVSHQQRERQLIGQLVKSLRNCARMLPRHASTASVSSNLSVSL